MPDWHAPLSTTRDIKEIMNFGPPSAKAGSDQEKTLSLLFCPRSERKSTSTTSLVPGPEPGPLHGDCRGDAHGEGPPTRQGGSGSKYRFVRSQHLARGCAVTPGGAHPSGRRLVGVTHATHTAMAHTAQFRDYSRDGGGRKGARSERPHSGLAVQGSGVSQLPRTLSRGGRSCRSSAPVGSGWPGAVPSGYSQARRAASEKRAGVAPVRYTRKPSVNTGRGACSGATHSTHFLARGRRQVQRTHFHVVTPFESERPKRGKSPMG
jgi:hypothetical protein